MDDLVRHDLALIDGSDDMVIAEDAEFLVIQRDQTPEGSGVSGPFVADGRPSPDLGRLEPPVVEQEHGGQFLDVNGIVFAVEPVHLGTIASGAIKDSSRVLRRTNTLIAVWPVGRPSRYTSPMPVATRFSRPNWPSGTPSGGAIRAAAGGMTEGIISVVSCSWAARRVGIDPGSDGAAGGQRLRRRFGDRCVGVPGNHPFACSGCRTGCRSRWFLATPSTA